ncbi:MAG: DUF7383 domain-containing protein [Halobacteriota archaeon]
MTSRANYATLFVGAQLGPEDRQLDLDWATFVGDETDAYEFTVPTDSAEEPYIGVQAFDVGDYGHEIELNGQALGGFDIPPCDGWQYWVDTLSNVDLVEDTNTVRICRDIETRDRFAIGTVIVHWKERQSGPNPPV